MKLFWPLAPSRVKCLPFLYSHKCRTVAYNISLRNSELCWNLFCICLLPDHEIHCYIQNPFRVQYTENSELWDFWQAVLHCFYPFTLTYAWDLSLYVNLLKCLPCSTFLPLKHDMPPYIFLWYHIYLLYNTLIVHSSKFIYIMLGWIFVSPLDWVH